MAETKHPDLARVDDLVERIRPMLVVESLLAHGGTLAVLVAGFIARHGREERDIQLRILIETIRALVSTEEALMMVRELDVGGRRFDG